MYKIKDTVILWMLVVCMLPLAYGKTNKDLCSASALKAAKTSGIELVSGNGESFKLKGTKKDSWGYLYFADKGTPDIELAGTFKIIKAAKPYSIRCEYWPLNFHYSGDEPGYDFAIIARAENSGAFYRIQFSTTWNEVSLWKEGEPGSDPSAPSLPSGFFARVKTKTGIRLNRDYKFMLRVVDNKLEFFLNDKNVLSYEDKVLPLKKGGCGLGVFNGADVQITGLKSGKSNTAVTVKNVKRPDFKVVNWHGSQVIFDGEEPIARQAQGTAAWLTDVKYKPGYRAQQAWPFIFDNRDRASAWVELKATGNTVSGKVKSSRGSYKYVAGTGAFTLSYDAKNDVYSYDIKVNSTLKKDNKESRVYNHNQVYYANIYTYNPMPTTDKSVRVNFQNWSTASAPYQFAIVKLADGALYRWPIRHYYGGFVKAGYSGGSFWSVWNNMKLAQDSCLIFYPEKVVSPKTQIVSVGDNKANENIFDSCCQFWDMHFWYAPVENGKVKKEFKAGESFSAHYIVTGCPATEAGKLAQKAKPLPCFDLSIERPYYVDGVNKFDQGGNVMNTPGKLTWNGGCRWDKSTGRDDKYSMRMENNASCSVFIGYNGSSAESKKARISMWIKSDIPWNGNGVQIGLEGRGRFGGSDRQWGKAIVPSNKEWRQVVYDIPFPTYNLICVSLRSQGQGKVWIDDFQYEILEK